MYDGLQLEACIAVCFKVAIESNTTLTMADYDVVLRVFLEKLEAAVV